MIRKVLFFGFLPAVLFLGFWANRVLGQAGDVAISPLSFTFALDPGASVSDSVRLYNNTDIPVRVVADPRNLVPQGERGQSVVTDNETDYPLADWIKVKPAQIQIPAKSSQDFEFTIRVPKLASLGAHFGGITLTVTPARPAEAANVFVTREITPIILLNVKGDTKLSAEVASLSTDKRLFNTGPVPITTRIKNTGNAFFKFSGTVTIYNLFNRQVASLTLSESTVFPDTIRQFETTWDRKWPFGFYRVKMRGAYDNADNVLTAETSFWALPYRLLLPILLAGGLLAATMWWRRTRGRTIKLR